MAPGSKKERTIRSATRRRKSMTSSMQMNRDSSLAPSAYSMTGQLLVDLPVVAQELGIEFTPPVQLVILPPPAGQPATEPGPLPSPEAGGEEEPTEPPPPPPSPYQQRIQAITDKYQFYQPRVRLQLRSNVAQRDSETGQVSGPAHGVQVSGWRCEADHLAALRRCFGALDTLTTLSLNNAALDEPAVNALATLLAERPAVTIVNLDSNPGVGALVARLLAPPANVQSLSLRNCAVTDDDLAALRPTLSELSWRQELRYNTLPLRTLNLGNNRLTDVGAATLAGILRSNRQLRCVSLTRNNIGTAGAVALAAVLRQFPLTHDEVVASRRARAEARRVLAAHVGSDMKSKSCCAGKCTHTSRRSDADPDGRASPASTGRGGQRAGSRAGRSPAKALSGAGQRGPEPPPPPAPSLEESVDMLMAGVVHPMMTLVRPEDGHRISPGNLVLASLSLAYNAGVGAPAAAAFLATLRYQEAVLTEEQARLGPGLLRLCLVGTPADGDAQLAALLLHRHPPLEEPDLPVDEEERKSGRAGRQSQLALDSSRRTASRMGRKKGKAK